MFDIHCHILPGLDDGPKSIEDSLKMLEIAKRDGIEMIVATPHIMDGLYNNSRGRIIEGIRQLSEHVKGVKILPGADIRICIDLAGRIQNGEIPLINDKNYFLLELPGSGTLPVRHIEDLLTLLRKKGLVPIITHPERNMLLSESKSIMEKFLNAGALFQITAGSIMGRFGAKPRETAMKMIKKGHVHAVASDAHDHVYRPPVLSEAYRSIADKFGLAEANRLFRDNPFKIIMGQFI